MKKKPLMILKKQQNYLVKMGMLKVKN